MFGFVSIANPDVDHDSSNETSLHLKERKLSKDNSAASKMGRKASSNLENSHIQNEEKYVTDKFREYLLFGSGKDALGMFIVIIIWIIYNFKFSCSDKLYVY